MKKIFSALCILLLTSCAAQYETYYVFDNIKGENNEQCVKYCQSSKLKCANTCRNNGEFCKKSTNSSAKLEDQSYLKDIAIKDEVSFQELTYNSIQCTEISCDCERDYRACYQMCGGTIHIKKRCIANCSDP